MLRKLEIQMIEKMVSSVLQIFNALNESFYLHPLSFSFSSFLLFLFFLYKWLSTNSLKFHNSPPSPPKLPILGHLHKLDVLPHRTLKSWSERYGELMLIHMGTKPTLVASSARVAKEIMKTHDAVISNRFKFINNDKLLYSSRDVAAAPYGEYWRQMKSVFVLQLLSNKRVRSFRGIREEETALLMKKIQQNAASVVNLSAMFMVLTNDVVCRVAFGRKYGSENCQLGDVDFKVVLKDFVELLGTFNVGDFIPWLAWVNRFNGISAKLEKVSKSFDLLLEEILTEHSDQLRRQGNNCDREDENEGKDFVDVLLQIQKDKSAGFSLTRENIKALIMDVFAAGTDTTYTVLEWAMAELLRHPGTMEEVQKEVRGIGGNKDHITEDDLENAKYLKAIIKETLRLYPPIPLVVPRVSTQDVRINGYDVASGTLFFVNAWAVQRDPLTWEKPEEFRPERFLNSSIDLQQQDFGLVPFGGGRRMCPGMTFALANNELALANLVHKFNWDLPAEVEAEMLDMSECSGLTIHRKTPLLAIATPHIF